MKTALAAVRFFLPEKTISGLEPFGTGNINDTYLVTLQDGMQMILQRVNPAVFPEPLLVHSNIRLVTSHLKRELQKLPDLENRFIPLALFRGIKGDAFKAEDGAIWRLVNYVPGKTVETVSKPKQAEELGRCLGNFHGLLTTLEPEELADTLPGFHDTQAYLDLYDEVRLKYAQESAGEIDFCHRFIDERRELATLVSDLPGLGNSVIHGDPKVANFIVNNENEKVVSLIDLDTVRAGLLLHDIGDALRSCCNPIGESPTSYENVRLVPELFSSWISGYFDEAEMLLTNEDKAHIVHAVQVIAFELGLRFVTDHLGGDRYFKIHYPGHNLFRAQVQFHLVKSIEDQYENLQSIVNAASNN